MLAVHHPAAPVVHFAAALDTAELVPNPKTVADIP